MTDGCELLQTQTGPMTASHGACSAVEIEVGEAETTLPIEFDDQVYVDFKGHILRRWQGVDLAGELAGVPFEPVGDVVAADLLHVVAQDLANPFLEGDGLAGFDAIGGDVGLVAIDQDVTVGDDLAGGPDGLGDAEA